MNQTHIILYVPGLGDQRLDGQRKALGLWKIYGVQTEICAMKWLEDEPWKAKLERLLSQIDFHAKEGKNVSLVGISAGSTAALQALIKRRGAVSRVVLICPKFQYPETVHPLRYQMNPSFKNALLSSIKAVGQLTKTDKSKIKIFVPIYDNFLPHKETYIPEVKREVMPSITHVGGIAYAITLGSWRIIRFIRSSGVPYNK